LDHYQPLVLVMPFNWVIADCGSEPTEQPCD
jgi:hypothetical protein